MNGRWIAGGLIAFAAVFAAALWYFQTQAFYAETEAEGVEIAGTRYAVADWQGIDAPTSPLKLRACFRMAEAPEAPIASDPVPLVAPAWFDCFDAERLARDLAAGAAEAFVAAQEEQDGVDRIVARYPDGSAFMWRQLNEKYAE